MTEAERFKLRHGPYHPWRCRVGKPFCCKLKGE
jgi:hypothetical protein